LFYFTSVVSIKHYHKACRLHKNKNQAV